ncbi:MAG TPA: lysozyme [Candidatus Acidoferrum sp.]|nr:lysozyme [Candidatus Acidoferrum sp.]
MASTLLPSTPGTQLIKQHEGARQDAYADAVGVPTICYGSTRGVFLGQHATLAECEQRLLEDATYAGKAIGRMVQVKLTQRQYDAMVSFVFNVGETNFRKSTLLRKINAGDCYGAGAEFDRWVYAGGRKLRGLVIRRAAERQEFESGCSLW